MPSSRYWELTVEIPEEASEGATNFIWELGALGVVEEETPGTPSRLRAFFPEAVPAATLEARVREYLGGLSALGFGPAGAPRVAPFVDEDWATAWRTHFRAIPAGHRLVVAPPWDTDSANGRLRITIEPGRAFGTGHHGSTAGCLQTLEAIVERDRPATAIDLGTGSGILAIALARLGVGSVLAIDDDPDAVRSAQANVAANRVAEGVRCALGDAGALVTDGAPLVVANLLAAAHRRLAPRYGRYVLPRGALVLGGILDAEAEEVADALRPHGFERRASVSVEGWTTLELGRTGRDPARAPVRDHA